MAISILNSANSFVRFSESVAEHCLWGEINFCLPVYEAEDVYFQFIIQGTEAEIDALIQPGAAEVVVSLVDPDNNLLLAITEKPDRFRLSETQLLYNWENGFPGFPGNIEANECFKVRVVLDDEFTFYSNCFERIMDPCFTSVLEYSNDEDAFGFKYCYSGPADDGDVVVSCEPTNILFTNVSTLAIPYTAQLQAQYGNLPNVQIWIYDPNGVLTNMGVQAQFDSYPPTVINIDMGGPASGVVVIR